EGEEDDADGLIEKEAEREAADHSPPRLSARGELRIALAWIFPAQQRDDDARDDEQRLDGCRGVDHIGGKAEDRAHAARPLASATMRSARVVMGSAESTRSRAR